jgi:hypothetical protein
MILGVAKYRRAVQRVTNSLHQQRVVRTVPGTPKDVYQTYYSEEQQDWVYENRTGLLMFRRVLTAIKPAKINPDRKETDAAIERET